MEQQISLCEQHRQSLDKVHTKLDNVLIILKGDDQGEKLGLVSLVNGHDKFISSIKRMIWIVVGAGLSALTMISLYWALFRIHPAVGG